LQHPIQKPKVSDTRAKKGISLTHSGGNIWGLKEYSGVLVLCTGVRKKTTFSS